MPKAKKGTLNEDRLLDVPTDEVATDAKTPAPPDDFFGGLMTTDNPLDALSSENTVIDDPAKPDPEPEETPGPDDEVEDDEVEEEEEEAPEDTADPKRKGKPRNVRYREKLQRREKEIATLTREVESLRINKPIVDMVLEEARLRGQPASKTASLKAPERPTRPVRPANFSRERASEDPVSADAKYLDARDEYQDSMEDYQLDREEFDHKVTEMNTIEAEEKQTVAAQEQWWSDFNNGLAAEARKDPNIEDDQVTAEVQKVNEFLAKPEAYDPTLMWRYARAVLNAPKGVKPAKTPVKPAPMPKVPPVPSVATGNASVVNMPKGWIQGADADEVAEQFHKDLASL